MSRQAPYPGGPSPQGSLPGAQRSRYRRNRAPGGTHEVILQLVPPGSRVLDLGCATGYLGPDLATRGCLVWGLDVDAAAVSRARVAGYEDVRVVDLDEVSRLPWPERFFDVILAADVLEHLRDPVRTLRIARHHVRPGGRIIVSLPNVAHLSVRLPLLVGRFEYRDAGILDRTHLHLYTYRSASELAESAGLRVSRRFAGSNHFGRLLNRSPILLRILGGCLAYNIVLLCTPATPCLSTEQGPQR